MTILDRILAHKRVEVAEASARLPLQQIRDQAGEAPPRPPGRHLRARLRQNGEIAVIAEVKKASPSKGVIRPDFDPVSLAATYARFGAAAVSVLTDTHFFQGGLDHLDAIRATVDLPLLRKEFIIDPYQVYEARVHGADAVLLIVAALDQKTLGDLLSLVHQLEMDALVEVHSEQELEVALSLGADLVGINNRDLETFETTLEVSRRLVPLIPREVTVVSESGISEYRDMQVLRGLGVHAVLVGEALARERNVGGKLSGLLGKEPPSWSA